MEVKKQRFYAFLVCFVQTMKSLVKNLYLSHSQIAEISINKSIYLLVQCNFRVLSFPNKKIELFRIFQNIFRHLRNKQIE